jgi:hypothetical protein
MTRPWRTKTRCPSCAARSHDHSHARARERHPRVHPRFDRPHQSCAWVLTSLARVPLASTRASVRRRLREGRGRRQPDRASPLVTARRRVLGQNGRSRARRRVRALQDVALFRQHVPKPELPGLTQTAHVHAPPGHTSMTLAPGRPAAPVSRSMTSDPSARRVRTACDALPAASMSSCGACGKISVRCSPGAK